MNGFDDFQFREYGFASDTGILKLGYAYKGGPEFEEILVFPKTHAPLAGDRAAALDRAFRLVFLLAGVSYYKAYVASRIHCEPFELDAVTADFLTRTYTGGLGEFAYRNGIDLHGKARFECSAASPPQAPPLNLQHRLLVPVGGGKDSTVTV